MSKFEALIEPLWDWNSQPEQHLRSGRTALIEPLWDWNQAGKTYLDNRGAALIEPLWDWNIVINNLRSNIDSP